MRKDVDPLGVACLLPGGEIKLEQGNSMGRPVPTITTQVEAVVSVQEEIHVHVGTEQEGCKKGQERKRVDGAIESGRALSITCT